MNVTNLLGRIRFRGVLLIIATLFATIIAVAVFLLNGSGEMAVPSLLKRSTQSSVSGASAASNGASEAGKSSQSGEKGSAEYSPPAVQLGRYGKFLDEICRYLTPAEEDRLVAQSNGDPRVLLGLVFNNSSRAERWLREALRKAPNDPLVHYAIVSRELPGFDRLRSAMELARLTPDDAAPLYAEALFSLKGGDRDRAISLLQQAAERNGFSSLRAEVIEAAAAAYILAGRTDEGARARVALQNGISGQWEMVNILQLEDMLGVMKNTRVQLNGNEQLAALLLDGYQKAIYSQGLDLESYGAARGSEIEYLRAFLAAANGETPSTAAQYLSAPASELFSAAKAEKRELDSILWFGHDKPGIYQRLDDSQKVELIRRVYTEGEVEAYKWALGVRPDIFYSKDFKPQSLTQEQWELMIAHYGGKR